MKSVYDIVSVVLFFYGVAAFVFLSDRGPATVRWLLVAAVAVATANQLGNAGHDLLAGALLVAASVYAFLVLQSNPA